MAFFGRTEELCCCEREGAVAVNALLARTRCFFIRGRVELIVDS